MINESYLELKVNFGRIGLEFNKPPTKFEFDDLSDLISYYPVEITLVDKFNEQDQIGKNIITLRGYFFDIDYIYNYNQSIFDAFDMCGGDANKIYDIIFDEEENIKNEYQTFCNNVFYIDRIYVEKDYRNKGYATLILNQLEDLIKYVVKLNIGIIVVCAQPFEKNGNEEKMIRDDAKLKMKLVELYKKVGFQETNSSYDYLIKLVEE